MIATLFWGSCTPFQSLKMDEINRAPVNFYFYEVFSNTYGNFDNLHGSKDGTISQFYTQIKYNLMNKT